MSRNIAGLMTYHKAVIGVVAFYFGASDCGDRFICLFLVLGRNDSPGRPDLQVVCATSDRPPVSCSVGKKPSHLLCNAHRLDFTRAADDLFGLLLLPET